MNKPNNYSTLSTFLPYAILACCESTNGLALTQDFVSFWTQENGINSIFNDELVRRIDDFIENEYPKFTDGGQSLEFIIANYCGLTLIEYERFRHKQTYQP